jgi:hypothetical protein
MGKTESPHHVDKANCVVAKDFRKTSLKIESLTNCIELLNIEAAATCKDRK